jgi:hypothetical protein
MAALADPDLKAEATKQRMDVAPVDGVEMESILRSAFTAPPAVIARYEELSRPAPQFETAKPMTVKAPLTAVENEGQKIRFDDKGKTSVALVASETDISVGGGKADAGTLKAGMVCAITYFGDRGQAKSVTCE